MNGDKPSCPGRESVQLIPRLNVRQNLSDQDRILDTGNEPQTSPAIRTGRINVNDPSVHPQVAVLLSQGVGQASIEVFVPGAFFTQGKSPFRGREV